MDQRAAQPEAGKAETALFGGGKSGKAGGLIAAGAGILGPEQPHGEPARSGRFAGPQGHLRQHQQPGAVGRVAVQERAGIAFGAGQVAGLIVLNGKRLHLVGRQAQPVLRQGAARKGHGRQQGGHAQGAKAGHR